MLASLYLILFFIYRPY